MDSIVAVYASPRRSGNTATLLGQAVKGARDAGACVEEIVLRDAKISPCLEIYGCRQTGSCVIRDDFHAICDKLLNADAIMIASPVFFYSVSAHLKIFMDRCQSLWVKKYWIDKTPSGKRAPGRKTLLICAGATKGAKLFDGILLSIKYFLDVLDAALWRSLLFRGLDFEKDVLGQPQFLEQAYQAGHDLALVLSDPKDIAAGISDVK
jgi:multimeric flavodoxin WrbA